MHLNRPKSPQCAAGFTLVEAMIAVFVLAVGTVGIAQLLGTSAQQAEAMRSRSTELELAQQLMDEIAAHPVADWSGAISLGKEAGETRATFDQVDDYNGYTDNTASMTMIDGTPIAYSGGPTYTRTVAVEYRNTPAGSSTNSATAPFCVATVTLSTPGQPPVVIVRLFSRASGGM